MIPTFLRNSHIWAPGFLRDRAARLTRRPEARRVWVVFADHYEPYWRNADAAEARARVNAWCTSWPAIAARRRDSAGKRPRYTFFYAEEHYRPDLLDRLAEMASEGIADVEVHIHHDRQGEADFVGRMRRFTETLLLRHRLLREVHGKPAFGFIHGNWALANSRPNGMWCGLDHELLLLKDLGCYADFTLPAAPHPAQTALVNTIYWATNIPGRPKSHDGGVPVARGCVARGDLLIVPGPLGINLRGTRRLIPRLESGELADHDPPVPGRARSWLALAPQVGSDIFLKLFTHGAQEPNLRMLLGGGLERCIDDLRLECDRLGLELHFASAWETRLAIDAICRGDDPVPNAEPVASNGGLGTL